MLCKLTLNLTDTRGRVYHRQARNVSETQTITTGTQHIWVLCNAVLVNAAEVQKYTLYQEDLSQDFNSFHLFAYEKTYRFYLSLFLSCDCKQSTAEVRFT